ncbi:hypothetical protein [Streptomyces sp. WM6378]|uniref:hypothetical protein n=1 Tax=Streptomyces sp. WM6378 TaxID=1415557 RepID=UPI0006AED836|nr:hypothetical protein [Streptomyces sp. WM6378]KOU43614.1 hypothetical protein ADK54_17650 [Streptomyces sp. WM6378]
MNADQGHLPTRACPHRQCTLLHHLVLLMLLPGLLTAVTYGGAATAVLLALLGGVQLGVMLLAHALAPEGPPRPWEHRPLSVRRGWAALAIVTDLLGLLVALALMTALAIDRAYAAVPPPTSGTLAALGALSALLALHYIAHRRATVAAALTEPVNNDTADDDWIGESFVWEPGDRAAYSK